MDDITDQVPPHPERGKGSRHEPEHASDVAELRFALAERDERLRIATAQIEALQTRYARCRLDLTNVLAREVQARLYAYYDELTGLANRRLLKDRFEQASAQGARQHRTVAVLLLDLDDFKTVNDRLGHEVGDEVLRAVAARLMAGTRSTDTVCRYGGDEFIILIPEVESVDTAERLSLKLRTAINDPVVTEHYSIRISASAGFINYPRDGATWEAILHVADDGLYRAKRLRSKVSIFALGDSRQICERVAMPSSVHRR